jgi:hypothetical protein
MYVYSQKIAKRKASYKRAGACWHYKKSGRNGRQHINKKINLVALLKKE